MQLYEKNNVVEEHFFSGRIFNLLYLSMAAFWHLFDLIIVSGLGTFMLCIYFLNTPVYQLSFYTFNINQL